MVLCISKIRFVSLEAMRKHHTCFVNKSSQKFSPFFPLLKQSIVMRGTVMGGRCLSLMCVITTRKFVINRLTRCASICDELVGHCSAPNGRRKNWLKPVVASVTSPAIIFTVTRTTHREVIQTNKLLPSSLLSKWRVTCEMF